jgi:hypothetical protein
MYNIQEGTILKIKFVSDNKLPKFQSVYACVYTDVLCA